MTLRAARRASAPRSTRWARSSKTRAGRARRRRRSGWSTGCSGAGVTIVRDADPCALPKACKNAGRDRGHPRRPSPRRRRGHALPGLARPRSAKGGKLREIDAVGPAGGASASETGELRDLSFDTISGAGPNGAIVHYRASAGDRAHARAGQPLSGRFRRPVSRRHHRHHPHGGDRRAEPPRCATASPACSRAISRSPRRAFRTARRARSSTRSRAMRCGRPGSTTTTAPATASAAISRCTKGRSASPRCRTTSPLQPGMIVSNEPGYYKTGAYGIRIENLVAVREAKIEGAEPPHAGLRDADPGADRPRLVEPGLLTEAERRGSTTITAACARRWRRRSTRRRRRGSPRRRAI